MIVAYTAPRTRVVATAPAVALLVLAASAQAPAQTQAQAQTSVQPQAPAQAQAQTPVQPQAPAQAQTQTPVQPQAQTPVQPQAQTPIQDAPLPADATLARLIDESLAALPELRKSQTLVQVQTERAAQAGSFADPMLQLGLQNDGFTSLEIGRMPTSYVSFMASQTLPWPGKRALRTQVAELGVSVARQSVTRVQLSTRAAVRRAYLALLLARDRLALLAQLEELWQQSFGTARVRYESGDGAQSDVMRAQLELTRIKQRRIALQAEAQGRVEELNRLRNHKLDEAIETPTHVRDLPAPATLAARFSIERTLAQSPELAAARLGTSAASHSVALAEKSTLPDLTVGAGIMVRGSLPPMWLLTLAGPLPVFAGSKQQREVAENRAWQSAAEQDVASLEQLLRLRVEQRHTALRAVLQSLELYDQGLLVQSEATAESTLSQYKVGKVSFASVLEANAGLIADQEGYLQALAAAHLILIADAELSLAAVTMSPDAGASSTSMPGAGASSMPSAGSSGAGSAAPASAARASGGSAASM